MKRILIVLPFMFDGGTEQVAVQLANNLLKKGNQINLLVLSPFSKEKSFYKLEEKINVLSLHAEKNYILHHYYRYISNAYSIKKFCKLLNIDTCISFMEGPNICNSLSKLIFLNKSKVISTVHLNQKSRHAKRFWIFTKCLYPFSDQIIFVSKKISYSYKNLKNKLIIYNSFDNEKISKLKLEKINNKKEKKIFEDKNVLIAIGRLEDEKNFSFLIDVFYDFLKLSNINYKLVILGEGSEKKELIKKIKELNLENNVFLLGVKKNPFKYIQNSRVLVQTSKDEGFGNVLVEALACGKPIIANDCESGPREIILDKLEKVKTVKKRYGVLIPYNNKDLFVKALKENLEDKNFLKPDLYLKRAKDFDVKLIIEKWERII